MPIVINKATGLAENIPGDKLSEALKGDQYEVPVIDEAGETVSIPHSDLQQAISSQKYRQPSQEELSNLMTYAENATPIKQAKAAAVAGLKGATMGASSIFLDKTGLVPAEEQKNLEIVNPKISGTFEVGGFLGSAAFFPEAGIAKALTRAGQAGKAVAALAGATEATRLGRLALVSSREAAEAALFQASDELTKQFVFEPEKSIAQSIADVGLAATVGAGWGVGVQGGKFAVNKLYKATKELPLVERLSAIKAKFDEGQFADDVTEVAQKAGIQLKPEMSALLSKDPVLRKTAKELAERADTAATKEMQASIAEFKDQLNESILSTLGKTAEDLKRIPSTQKIAKEAKKDIESTLRPLYEQAQKMFEPVREYTKEQLFPRQAIQQFTKELATISQERGWLARKFTDKNRALVQIAKDLQSTRTFDDFALKINGAISDLREQKMFDVAKKLHELRDEYEDRAERYVLDEVLGPMRLTEAAKNAIRGQQREARTFYNDLMKKVRGMGKILKLKADDVSTPEKFFSALREKNSRLVAKNLSVDSVEMYEFLSKNFSNVANRVKELKTANIKLKTDEAGVLKPRAVLEAIKNMSPEARAFTLTPEASARLEALADLSARLGKTKEIKSIENAMKYVPGGAAGLMSYMMTGNLATAGLFFAAAQVGRKAFVEMPDSMKMSMLKMLASDTPISGSGFKAMFDMASAMEKGFKKQAKAVSSVFKPASKYIETSIAPTSKSLGILDRAVTAAQANPEQLQSVSDDLGHYVPDHSAHLTMTSMRAVSYLASLRPKTQPDNPLDREVQPSDVEIARYNRALAIVEQPLMVLKHVKDGTITPGDIETISTVYPSLYEDLKQKMLEQLMDMRAKKATIDYKTQLGLTLFLGQPLESSTQPQNIMSNQLIHAPPMPPQAPRTSRPSSMKSSKMPEISSTPEQIREQKRSK